MSWIYFRYTGTGQDIQPVKPERFIKVLEIDVDFNRNLEIDVDFQVIEIDVEITNQLDVEIGLC